mmetsp:Transcript_40214/g.116139  ORF Transcript_40214/g.116139 Transcript_40214/m.116139 type:complete len:230 (+) Transcript_40214:135-824(+)
MTNSSLRGDVHRHGRVIGVGPGLPLTVALTVTVSCKLSHGMPAMDLSNLLGGRFDVDLVKHFRICQREFEARVGSQSLRDCRVVRCAAVAHEYDRGIVLFVAFFDHAARLLDGVCSHFWRTEALENRVCTEGAKSDIVRLAAEERPAYTAMVEALGYWDLAGPHSSPLVRPVRQLSAPPPRLIPRIRQSPFAIPQLVQGIHNLLGTLSNCLLKTHEVWVKLFPDELCDV